MDGFDSSEEDYYYSDGESLNGLEDDDSDVAVIKGPSTKVITRESLLAAQREDLRRVTELLSVRDHHARTLLIHHRWNVEKVFSVFAEKGKASLFSEAGVTLVEERDSSSLTSSKLTCNICMEDVPGTKMTKMDCGHSFCNTCWTEHFIVKINEGQSKRIKCMAYKCYNICDEVVVKTLVSKKHPDLAEKFDRFLLESYIDDNERVKWCPSAPHCGNAIRVEEDVLCEVECSCGSQFCFRCLAETHSPCSCKMWDLWSQKCRDESETVNWLTVNTKPCPKCYKPVEKNGGCNLVVCICGQAFCWLCGGATGTDHTWTSISGHSCGRFKDEDLEKEKRAKRELYRYMHYYNRYKAHTESLKLESNLKDTVKERVDILEGRESIQRDFNWITDGLKRLFQSRKVLSYSYPFAYYMFGEDFFKDEMTQEEREMKQNLFEDQQQQFEQNIERLSKSYQTEFDNVTEEELVKKKKEIITMSVLTDNFCKKMYECIENELLGSLKYGSHSIAPYYSKGIEKATELSAL